MLGNVVSCSWLQEHVNDLNVVILDCRFELGNHSAGYEAYLIDHIPNALYVDLEKDMSSKVNIHGGRHPLPDLTELAIKLGAVGINDTTTVIAYDDQGGAMAARLWWLLKYLGHDKVFVLNGSYSLWKASKFRTTTTITQPIPKTFTPKVDEQMLVTVKEVKEAIGDEQFCLVDSRDSVRYLGIEEPVDKKAGHIPTARNYFWKNCLTEKNEWKTEEVLKKQFNDIDYQKKIIVYCGSGVTACPNILALKSIGYEHVLLYIGSWSDWISYAENEIAVEEKLMK